MRDHDWLNLALPDQELCVCTACGCLARLTEPGTERWEFFAICKYWIWLYPPCSLQPWMIS